MADDSEYTEPEETSDGRSGTEPAPPRIDEPSGAAPNEGHEDREEDDDNEEPGDPQRSKVRTMRDVNRLVPGILTVHYIQRDVSLAMDGDAAVRTIATWHDQHDGFTDPLHPVSSSAINGWVGIDLAYVMGLTWMPTLSETQRITIDPRP